MANIAVFGAPGTIGSRIVAEALQRDRTVTAVVRDPAKLADPDSTLRIVTGDVLQPAAVTAAAKDQDVVVSAVGEGDGPAHAATIAPAACSLVESLRVLGDHAPRLITVGGAGSLRTQNGALVWDAPGLPAELLQIIHAHGTALDFYRTVTDISWTNVSPPAEIAAGERTGAYRTALDDLIVDEHGNSTISVEDYAVAVIDEIDNPRHIHQRFTVAY